MSDMTRMAESPFNMTRHVIFENVPASMLPRASLYQKAFSNKAIDYIIVKQDENGG